MTEIHPGSGKEVSIMMYSMMPFGRNNSLANFFNEFDRHFFGDAAPAKLSAFRTDIRDDGDRFVLDADLPGFNREDIHLELKGDVLTISAKHEDSKEDKDEKGSYICRERSTSAYSRSFIVTGFRADEIAATSEHGVLELTLPKQQPEVPQARRIEIQ